MRKRILALCMCLVLLWGVAPSVRAMDEEHMIHVISSGFIGPDYEDANIMWSLTTDYVLRVQGSGDMQNVADYYGADMFSWWRVNGLAESVIFDDGITEISHYCLADWAHLRRIFIPASVTSIGRCAFYRTSSIQDVYYGGSKAQWNAISIEEGNDPIQQAEIHYDFGETIIGTCAQYSSGYEWPQRPVWRLEQGDMYIIGKNAAKTDIPHHNDWESELFFIRVEGNMYENIGPQVDTVHIDQYVTDFHGSIFNSFSKLAAIEVDPANTALCSVDGIVYSADGQTLVRYPTGRDDKSFEVPQGVTTIAAAAFAWCRSIQSITIPASVTNIGYGAFGQCTGLTDVYFDGSQDQWESMKVRLPDATIHFGAEAAPTFSDVPANAYYADAVTWAVKNNITNGTGAATFSPDMHVSRSQAVTFLWRVMGSPEPKRSASGFSDVEAGSWYEKAVIWAVEQGITNGTGEDTFSPDLDVSRGQMMTFLYRTMGEPGKSGSGEWYSDAERWAKGNGLLDGTAVAYTTAGDCPRADVVYYLWKQLA